MSELHSRRTFLTGVAGGALAAWAMPALSRVRTTRAARLAEERERWKNWSGLVEWRPEIVERPRSVSEVQALVREASKAGRGVRVAGTGHSFTPLCATDGSTVLMSRLDGDSQRDVIEEVDLDQRQATVLAGAKLYQLTEPLADVGLAMTTLPDIDRQTLAGAVATATHGTGKNIGSLSTQVVGARLVVGSGEVVECSVDERADLLRAVRVHLGALGVVTHLRLALEPAFRLHERSWVESFEATHAQLDELIAGHRHFEFFWVSDRDACLIKTLDVTDEPEDLERWDDETKLTGERIGPSGDVFPSLRNTRFNEIEYSVAADRGSDCLLELRELMLGEHRDITWPIEYRTVAADDAYLSPMYGRPTVTLSLHQAADLDHRAFFADAEAVFRNHGGRPHWGKIHSLSAKQLEPLYPAWESFQEVRRELDPQGVFLNQHLRTVLGA